MLQVGTAEKPRLPEWVFPVGGLLALFVFITKMASEGGFDTDASVQDSDDFTENWKWCLICQHDCVFEDCECSFFEYTSSNKIQCGCDGCYEG